MGYKNESLINTIELGRAIKRRREELSLSLRDVADVTNVSASTLSRIENGTGKPDADNIARITSWLDMPVDRVMRSQSSEDGVEAVVYYPHEATPEIVEAHLRARLAGRYNAGASAFRPATRADASHDRLGGRLGAAWPAELGQADALFDAGWKVLM